MSDWFGPTGQGKLLESTSHEEKVNFFFEDVGHSSVATGRRAFSLRSFVWGMREPPTDGSFTLSRKFLKSRRGRWKNGV
jgi:hypothetical protein